MAVAAATIVLAAAVALCWMAGRRWLALLGFAECCSGSIVKLQSRQTLHAVSTKVATRHNLMLGVVAHLGSAHGLEAYWQPCNLVHHCRLHLGPGWKSSDLHECNQVESAQWHFSFSVFHIGCTQPNSGACEASVKAVAVVPAACRCL